ADQRAERQENEEGSIQFHVMSPNKISQLIVTQAGGRPSSLVEKSTSFTRRRHDALQPEVDGHVSILFVRMGDHSGEHAEYGTLALAHRANFGGLGVGERLEGLIAHIKGLLERRDQVGLRSLRAGVERLLLTVH